MCVRREGLLANGVRSILTLDSNQAGQHRPLGGRIVTGGGGHADSLRGTPKRAAPGF